MSIKRYKQVKRTERRSRRAARHTANILENTIHSKATGFVSQNFA